MRFTGLFQLSLSLLLATGATAKDDAHTKTCYEGESCELNCYKAPDNTPQNVKVEDVAKVAEYLRNYGRETEEGRFWTMKAKDAPDCAEWTVFASGSVLALAKHIDSDKDSSVLFEDIATTLDGGPDATDAEKAKAIIGCLTDGGSLGVLVNSTNVAYKSASYKEAGFSPEGILIKVVSSGKSEL